jgi:cytoskeleton protein RodZ
MTKENLSNELSEDIEVVGPGAMLAEARMAKGLSQRQVADKLNFTSALIGQIETENFDQNVPATFTRGYLRNYAKLVGVDCEDVLNAYDHLGVAQLHSGRMQSFSQRTRKQAENKKLMLLSLFILLLMIAMTVIWGIQESKLNFNFSEPVTVTQNALSQPSSQAANSEREPIQANAVSSEPAQPVALLSPEKSELSYQDDAQGGQADDTQLLASDTLSLDEQTVVPEQQSEPAAVVLPVEQGDLSAAADEEPEVIGAPAAVEVRFWFSGDCWVNIHDATGERIAWGVKKADYNMNITGMPPFQVTLGKPELVSIEYNGMPVDLSLYQQGHIAKFQLPLNE